jgi:hypothetical protein
VVVIDFVAGFESGHNPRQVTLVSELNSCVQEEHKVAEGVAHTNVAGPRAVEVVGAWAADDMEMWAFHGAEDRI